MNTSLRITATCSPEQASDELLAAILAAVGFDTIIPDSASPESVMFAFPSETPEAAPAAGTLHGEKGES